MSEAVGAKGPQIPRRCGQQRHRDKVPTEEPKEYYKRSIASPFGSFLTQLQERFSSDNQCVALGAYPWSQTVMKDTLQCSEHIKKLTELYKADLPSPQNLDMEMLSGTTARVRCRISQPIKFFSVTATLSQHCHKAEDCLHPSCYQLLL